jgi:hypothetical protein
MQALKRDYDVYETPLAVSTTCNLTSQRSRARLKRVQEDPDSYLSTRIFGWKNYASDDRGRGRSGDRWLAATAPREHQICFVAERRNVGRQRAACSGF